MASLISVPALWLIAGPNGVGKTTYAFRWIRQVSGSAHFVNLDEISRGLSPLEPLAARVQAARVALAMTKEFIRAKRSFSVETTLAGRTHLLTIDAARQAGFQINLLYFAVQSPAICIARVARRVSEGGHGVPEADIRRRFTRSAGNFGAYSRLATLWRVFDNNGPRPEAVAEGHAGCRAHAVGLDGLPASLAAVISAMPPCKEGG